MSSAICVDDARECCLSAEELFPRTVSWLDPLIELLSIVSMWPVQQFPIAMIESCARPFPKYRMGLCVVEGGGGGGNICTVQGGTKDAKEEKRVKRPVTRCVTA